MTDEPLKFDPSAVPKTQEFFELLYPDGIEEESCLVLATAGGPSKAKYSGIATFYGEAAISEASELISKERKQAEVYFGLGLRTDDLVLPLTGLQREITSLPGFALDIDIDPSKGGFASITDARLFLQELPLIPTVVVRSGSGLHSYWLFREPWTFAKEAEQEECTRYYEGWYEHLKSTALSGKYGVTKLDHTCQIQRVWRPVGSFNHKQGAPVLVSIDGSIRPDARYNAWDFEPYLSKTLEVDSTITVPRDVIEGIGEKLEIDSTVVLPPAILQLAVFDEDFSKIWWHLKRGDSPSDQSLWDFRIALYGIRHGWSSQHVVDAMVVNRRMRKPVLKADQYFARTLAKAHATVHPAEPELLVEEIWVESDAVSNLKQIRLATGVPIRALQRTGTLEDVTFTILLDDGESYAIEKVKIQSHWRECAGHLGLEPPKGLLKTDHWRHLIEKLVATSRPLRGDETVTQDRFKEAIEDYVAEERRVTWETKEEAHDRHVAIKDKVPHYYLGFLYVHPGRLQKWIYDELRQKLEPQKIELWLRRLRFEKEKVQVNVPKDARTKGSPTKYNATFFRIHTKNWEAP